MIPLTDLTPEAIRALPDDELRVRIMILQGWELDTSGRRPVLRKGTEIRAALMSDEDWYLPPRFPASYDAILPVVRAWLAKDYEREDRFCQALNGGNLSGYEDSDYAHDAAWRTGAILIVDATPRDLCVALLCAAREVGA